MPELGSSDYNGMAFDTYFGGAVQTMYTDALANPVVSANGQITDVAFSHAEATQIWTLMNVNNPDLLLFFTDQLPNTGQIVVEGNPEVGWTLVSWNGTPVPSASLPTELFVDVRDLIVAPQMAAYGIQVGLLNAIGTESLTPLLTAIQDGVSNVVTTTLHFPVAVISDIVSALGGSSPNAVADLGAQLSLDTLPGGFSLLGALPTDLTNLLPMAAADLPGALAGGFGTILGDILTAL